MHRPGAGRGVREVRWLDGDAIMVNTQMWRELGGFDERFKGYGADLDLCRRGREARWKFYVDDRVTFHDLGSQTVIHEGGEQNNVDEMNRVLREKWGVKDYTEMM